MAIMVPDMIRGTTVSSGERRLFNRFKRELSDDCYVLHSLGITEHHRKMWAEADYVVISPGGIFVIEVKSGGVSCKDGLWIYTDHHGVSFRKPEGPFEQAKSAMYSVKENLETNRGLRGLLCGYGVIMPDEHLTIRGPEIEHEVLLDRDNWHKSLSGYLKKIEQFWLRQYEAKHRRRPRLPGARERDAVRKHLRPDALSTYTLASRLNSVESQLVELTNEQLRTVRGIDNNPRTIIQGGAGTGKTILAVDRALSIARNGEKVLLLCFNRLLADSIQENIPVDLRDMGLIRTDSIHRYFRSVIERTGKLDEILRADPSDSYLYRKMYPETYMDCLMRDDGTQYDVVIVDEAQDLMLDEYLDAIDLTLIEGLDRGSWHLFIDRNQNIYGAESTGPERRLSDIGYAEFNLSRNCRNAMRVAVQTSIVSRVTVPLHGIADGGESRVVFYSDRADMIEKLEAEIRSLLSSGLTLSDFVVLSTRTRDNSSLSGLDRIADCDIRDLAQDGRPTEHAVDFCTMHSFKGLERRAVIAIDVIGIADPSSSVLLYSGLSRARTYLTVFLHESEHDGFQNNAGAFGTWLAENRPDASVEAYRIYMGPTA